VGGDGAAGGARDLVHYTDGASRGNPGDAGAGVLICDAEGNVLDEVSVYLGRTTNNVAEYRALILGLDRARRLGARSVRVVSDSELMVRQMNGLYRVRNPGIAPLYERARALAGAFETFRIEHVLRGRNARADELANRGIDRRGTPPHVSG
jgi:ribonuclease HI